MDRTKEGEPIEENQNLEGWKRVRFKDLLCHSEARFVHTGFVECPEIPSKFPKTLATFFACEDCGQKYCIITQEGVDKSQLIQIDNKEDEARVGDILADMLKEVLNK